MSIDEIIREIDLLSALGYTFEQIEEIENYRGMGYSLDSAIIKIER